jgi:hypothetical protein
LHFKTYTLVVNSLKQCSTPNIDDIESSLTQNGEVLNKKSVKENQKFPQIEKHSTQLLNSLFKICKVFFPISPFILFSSLVFFYNLSANTLAYKKRMWDSLQCKILVLFIFLCNVSIIEFGYACRYNLVKFCLLCLFLRKIVFLN